MKNKYEGFCFICGEIVPEQEGLAEQIPREKGGYGWGKTIWGVKHKECKNSNAAASNAPQPKIKSNTKNNGSR